MSYTNIRSHLWRPADPTVSQVVLWIRLEVLCSLQQSAPPVVSSWGRQTGRHTHMALWPLHPLVGFGVIFAAAHTLSQWVHILQVLAPQTHRPSNPWSGSCWCAQSPIHTCTQNRESLTQERVRKEFNKKIGQTAFFKAWPPSTPTSNCLCYRPFLCPYSSFFLTRPQIT